MKEPICKECRIRHWPIDGCQISHACVDCMKKDTELEALRQKLNVYEDSELHKMMLQGLARKTYQREYMAKRRRANA